MTRKWAKYKEIGEREVNYSEKAIQDKIIKNLKSRGFWVMKTQGGVAGTPIGTPDIIYCMNGRFWAIEVKKIGGKLSIEQANQLTKLAKAGAMIIVTNEVYFEKGVGYFSNYKKVVYREMSFKTDKTYLFLPHGIYEVIHD